jgi:methylisocitrate lyase
MVRGSGRLVIAPLALDPLSAALARKTGFDAVYLGGGGLGYLRAVTEALLTSTEVAEATRAITERVDIDVVVDGSVGFGDAVHSARAIRQIEQAGAVAIEIEDQVAPKRVHHHKGVEHLVSTEDMVGKIKASCDARRDSDFVIIVRCNAVSHEGIDAAIERCAAYEEAGADMLMVFARTDEELARLSAQTHAPLAAMSIGGTRPDSEMLAAGYALAVDPMSATVACFQALKATYQSLKDGRGTGMSREMILETIKEVGRTMDIDDLYAVEEVTTERPIATAY